MNKIRNMISIGLIRKIQLLIIWDNIKKYLVVPILIILAFVLYSLNNEYKIFSTSSLKILSDPFLSTLLAAILGGALAFYGSVYVQKSELRAQASIRRRDEIYIPIYNELLDLQSNLIEFPCPSGFTLNENVGYPNDPKFLVWNKFKTDYRKLQVPKILSSAFDEFNLLTAEYEKIHDIAIKDTEVELTLKRIISSNSVVDKSQRKDLAHYYLPCNNNLSVIIERLESELSKIENSRLVPVKSREEIQTIARSIFSECIKINIVNELQKIRKLIDYKNEELIYVLGIIIKHINEKFDQNTKLF